MNTDVPSDSSPPSASYSTPPEPKSPEMVTAPQTPAPSLDEQWVTYQIPPMPHNTRRYSPAPPSITNFEMSPDQYADVRNIQITQKIKRIEDAALEELKDLILQVAGFLERFHRAYQKTAQCPFWAHAWMRHVLIRFQMLGMPLTKEEIKMAAYRTAHIRQIHIGTDPTIIFFPPRKPYGPSMARLGVEPFEDMMTVYDERRYGPRGVIAQKQRAPADFEGYVPERRKTEDPGSL